MSAYAVIVALECATLGLAGLLVFQLYRVAKRNPLTFTPETENVPTLTDEVIEVSGHDNKISQRLSIKLLHDPALSSESSNDDQQNDEVDRLSEDTLHSSKPNVEDKNNLNKGPAAELLSDYIGEFFADDLQSDLSEMRTKERSDVEQSHTADKVQPESSTEEISSTEKIENAALLLKMRASDKVNGVAPKTVMGVSASSEELALVRPIILSEDQRVHEKDPDNTDGDVITVAEENEVSIVTGKDKTMSGKVVHAMLNEAEIVCVS